MSLKEEKNDRLGPWLPVEAEESLSLAEKQTLRKGSCKKRKPKNVR
jgi:hypothetical protein